MASAPISSDEQVLALATKRAVQAAGGLEVCSRETGLSTSHLSRCCSPHERDSITERDAATIEAITHGSAGFPHILSARARLLGCVVIPLPQVHDDPTGLQLSVCEISAEFGDVARGIAEALNGGGPGGTRITKAEAALVLEQMVDHDRASARLRFQLERIAKGEEPPG